MNMTEKISLWGVTHARARDAERAAAQHGGEAGDELHREARRLRESADRLHREICTDRGPAHRPDHPGKK